MSKRRANEVVVARGRLKGALQELANVNDDDDDLDASKPSRGRPPKRAKKEPTPPPQPQIQHSFIMKLFDRCVDLAKYNEHTALYPICRAWMLNQPRSNAIINYKTKKEISFVKREENDDLLEDIKAERITEISDLPPCKDVDISRIPLPLPFQKNSNSTEDVDRGFDGPKHDRNVLLTSWKERWCQVRKKWLDHTKDYEEKKHGVNMAILEALYKK
ncbi:protein lin-37 homolog [Contarinia nasturtii]|uniref:protein lin-37 homolog n=1 Tax=Contarinia nasturtii TaxID=265458 RepID=UPI0012D3ABAA|nr:protein lin-37 homolog [Contarinia nasturtii]